MSDVLTDEERWIVDAERHFVEQGFPDNGKGKLLAIIDKLTREIEVARAEETVCAEFQARFLDERRGSGRVGVEASPRGFRTITETERHTLQYSAVAATLAEAVAKLKGE